MSSEQTDDRADFEFLSGEYAQALQALETIEKQASTIVAFGGSEELKPLIDQFIEMAMRTKSLASEKGQQHFVDWFSELIEKAEALRTAIVRA